MAEAKRIYDKLIKEKIAKGYIPGEDGTPYGGSANKIDTGIRPQLLNAVTEAEAERLLRDDAYFLQPKLDGRRPLLLKREGKVTGINRRGRECGVPEPKDVELKRPPAALPHTFALHKIPQFTAIASEATRLGM